MFEVFVEFMLSVQVFWVVTLNSTVTNFRRFERQCHLKFQGLRRLLRNLKLPVTFGGMVFIRDFTKIV
jgi:hypothetical protein